MFDPDQFIADCRGGARSAAGVLDVVARAISTAAEVLKALGEPRRAGVGTWLAYDKRTNALVGFCGFENSPRGHDPQLVYAVFECFTGRGFATEMARASIAQARAYPGFAEIVADVDEINAASVHVLGKLGFERIAVHRGAFGKLLLFRLPASR